MTEFERFVVFVRRMREMQRAYFRERRDRDLRAAKELEWRVDQFLLELARGPDLFANLEDLEKRA